MESQDGQQGSEDVGQGGPPGWVGKSRWVLPLVDVVLLNAVTTFAFLVRFWGFPSPYNWGAYLRLFPWDAAALVAIFYVYGLYDTRKQTASDLNQHVVTAVIVNGFATLAITFLATTIGFPRSVFLISAFLQVPVFVFWRRLYRSLTLRDAPATRVLLVCRPEDVGVMTREAGQFLPRIEVEHVRPDASLPDLSRAGAVLLSQDVPFSTRQRYFVECLRLDIPCLWVPDAYDLLVSGSELTSLGGSPFMELQPIRIRRGSLAVKRLADVVLSALGLVVLSPLMACIALVIKRTSPGPALYWQERVTVGGRIFRLVKFRTMYQEAEDETGPVLAATDDGRITPVGRVLRATHLDELPQLWNILRGEMSIVGPRPERPVFVDRFRRRMPHYDLRHQAPPGLTGLAQLQGGYWASPEDKVAFDLHYTKTQSLLHDMWLILKTLARPEPSGSDKTRRPPG
jgi:exopolysaccharide biosynthesis polyprenyl glycosylphosphotransferase